MQEGPRHTRKKLVNAAYSVVTPNDVEFELSCIAGRAKAAHLAGRGLPRCGRSYSRGLGLPREVDGLKVLDAHLTGFGVNCTGSLLRLRKKADLVHLRIIAGVRDSPSESNCNSSGVYGPCSNNSFDYFDHPRVGTIISGLWRALSVLCRFTKMGK